jgi:hypothetical protein
VVLPPEKATDVTRRYADDGSPFESIYPITIFDISPVATKYSDVTSMPVYVMVADPAAQVKYRDGFPVRELAPPTKELDPFPDPDVPVTVAPTPNAELFAGSSCT